MKVIISIDLPVLANMSALYMSGPLAVSAVVTDLMRNQLMNMAKFQSINPYLLMVCVFSKSEFYLHSALLEDRKCKSF